MPWRALRPLVVAVSTALFVLSPTGPAQAQATESITNSGGASGEVSANGFCSFETRGDFVHISSTPPRTASAHGWWINHNCSASRAVVTVQLQIKRNGTWANVGSAGVKTVPQGGGSVARSVGRFTCLNTRTTEWRSVVDVDIVGQPDDASKLYTSPRTLSCGA